MHFPELVDDATNNAEVSFNNNTTHGSLDLVIFCYIYIGASKYEYMYKFIIDNIFLRKLKGAVFGSILQGTQRNKFCLQKNVTESM
jgi:hypothetical protein